MTIWQECRLDDYLELAYGKPLTAATRVEGEYPVYGSGGISGSHNEAIVKGPGIIVGRKGTVGSVYWENKSFFPIDTVFYVVQKADSNLRFLYYLLKSLPLENMNTDAAVPGLNRNNVYRLKVPDISLGYQSEIANILGTIDNKIELNQRMNETLEAMAKALFKSWFVDFEPVHAKAEGRKPEGMDAATAALFPAAFNEAGLPEGWTQGSLGKIAESAGVTVQPNETSPDTPYIGLEHMPRRCIALSEWEGAGKVTSNKFAFKCGDFLFGKLRPYFHKVGIAAIDGISSTDILIVRPKQEAFYAFVLALISGDEFVKYTDQSSRGTKMPRTNWKDMAAYSIVLPDRRIAASYNAAVKPMLEKIIANIHESRVLAELRDSLLPKLISGELRIQDVRAQVKDVL